VVTTSQSTDHVIIFSSRDIHSLGDEPAAGMGGLGGGGFGGQSRAIHIGGA
jgi:hypothetical protein